MTDIDLSAARQVALPAFIPPMLATPIDRAFSDPDWLFELKLDGYRVQAIVHGKAVQAAHAERQGRSHLLPRLRRRAGDLDRRLRRHRRRRDGGARRVGQAGLQPAPGPRRACAAWASTRGERAAGAASDEPRRRGHARLPRLRPAPSRQLGPPRRPARGAQAPPAAGAPRAPLGALREPHPRAWRGLPEGRHRAGPGGQRRQAAAEPL